MDCLNQKGEDSIIERNAKGREQGWAQLSQAKTTKQVATQPVINNTTLMNMMVCAMKNRASKIINITTQVKMEYTAIFCPQYILQIHMQT